MRVGEFSILEQYFGLPVCCFNLIIELFLCHWSSCAYLTLVTRSPVNVPCGAVGILYLYCILLFYILEVYLV